MSLSFWFNPMNPNNTHHYTKQHIRSKTKNRILVGNYIEIACRNLNSDQVSKHIQRFNYEHDLIQTETDPITPAYISSPKG